MLNDYARRARAELSVVVEVDAIPQIKELVAAGAGHAVLSYNAVREDLGSGRLSGARITSPSLHRSVFLCGHAELPQTRAVRAVEKIILEVTAGLVETGIWKARLASP